MSMLSKDQLVDKYYFSAKNTKSFDAEQATLCIEISNDSFMCLLLTHQKEIQLIKQIQVKNGHNKLNIEDILSADAIFKERFKKVIISCFDIPYTIVPTAFFDENKKEEFLQFTNLNTNQTIFLHDELMAIESKMIYSIDASQRNTLNQFFPNNHLFCGPGLLIRSFNPIKKNKQTAFLYFRKNAIELLLHHKKIIFCNTFSIVTAEDVLYFLLSAVELNQFNQAEMDLIISGEIEKDSIWIKMIKKYFPTIIYSTIKDFQSDLLPFESAKQHQFYQLFNLIHCE